MEREATLGPIFLAKRKERTYLDYCGSSCTRSPHKRSGENLQKRRVNVNPSDFPRRLPNDFKGIEVDNKVQLLEKPMESRYSFHLSNTPRW